MNRSTITTISLALAALAPLSACGSSHIAQRYDYMVANSDREFDIEPGGEVLGACGLDATRSYFASGSSQLTDDDRAVLGDVGRCLTSGRLMGRSVLVTGYTDRDGTRDENLELGLARGSAVAAELASRGVQQYHIFVRSRGEGRADGETTAERALDRKVDLRLLDQQD